MNHRTFAQLQRLALLASFIVAAHGAPAFSQTASLRGTVSDSKTGDALPGANIVVSSASRKTGTASSGAGTFELNGLPAGTYRIAITYIGYEAFDVAELKLSPGESEVLKVRLEPTGVSVNPVTVTASRRPEKLLDAPAAITVLDARTIETRTALTPTEHLKGVTGVDIVTAGLNQSRVVVRGFNDLFSGSLLSMVDNRITRIPAVRLNAFQLIPTSNMDIERIEVVSGPAAALYGPNSAQGVMHVLTKSPFDSRGTTVSVGGGERNVLIGTARHAGLLRSNLGYKFSVQYYEGDDFESFDPLELAALEDARETGNPDTVRIAQRIFDIQSTTVDARIDWRIRPKMSFILNGGVSQGDNIEITDQGAAQALDASFKYLQGRFTYKNLFAQAFANKISTGETYLLRTGDQIVNNSSLFVAQAQHHFGLGTAQHLTYGLDLLLTRPQTAGTVNGRNENNDNVDEFGVYLQSETSLSTKLKLIAAARLDHHNRLDGLNFSPRAALVVKPAPGHNLRLTYNKAFSTPTSDNLFSDIDARRVPTLSIPGGDLLQPFIGNTFFNIRSLGTWPSGFSFRYDDANRPMMVSSFNGTNDYLPSTVNAVWPKLRAFFIASFDSQIPGVAALLEQKLPQTLSQEIPGLLQLVNSQARDESDAFQPVDMSFVEDIMPASEMSTTTFEIGYKALLSRKMLASIDLYHTRIKNFIGSLQIETPNVFVDPARLETILKTDMAAEDSLLASILASQLASLPIGIISPTQVQNGTDVIITNRNIGDVSVTGFDLSLTYNLNSRWNLTGNYSYVNKDYFKSQNGYRDIALNAPKHKFGTVVGYHHPETDFNGSLRLRFVDSFPVSSGIFKGTVERYAIMDLNAQYRLPFMSSTSMTVTVQNLLNNKHREFVGVPEIGRLAWVRLTRSL